MNADSTSSDLAPLAHGAPLEREIHAMLDALDRARNLARSRLSLSPLECLIVRALCQQPRTISELSRHLASKRSSISMAAQRLEQRDAITREVTGRRTLLRVSEEVRRQYVELGYAPIRAGIDRWLAEHDRSGAGSRDVVAGHAFDLLHMLTEVFDQTRDEHSSRDASADMHDALLRGDADSAATLAGSLVRDGQPLPAYLAMTDALHRIGDEWEAGTVSVVDERLATSTTERVIDRIRALYRPSITAPARGLRALVCNGVGERHDAPLRMVATELERLGWQVDLMTGDLPVDGLGQLCERIAPSAVFVGVSMAEHVEPTLPLVAALAATAPVYVGGQAFADAGSLEAVLAAGAWQRLDLADLAGLTDRSDLAA